MNVVAIMLDSLRPDHIGCYGNEWIKTPNIDRLASEGTIFERAYAEGLPTIPVRTALFTGKYTLPLRGWQRLEPTDNVMAEILWDKGYTSALISDTYHMHKPRMGFCRGFDFVEWIRGQECDPFVVDPAVEVDLSRHHRKNYAVRQYPNLEPEETKRMFVQYLKNTAHWRDEEDHFVAQVVKASIKWLETLASRGKGDRVFLWVDSFDPHEPWDPPPPYDEMYAVPGYEGLPITWAGGFAGDFTLEEIRHVRAQYAGEVTMVDRWVGLLLERMDELGLMDNTLIVLLSDHGEPLGEHGIIKKVRPWPYEELSRIPLIVRHPDGIGKDKRVRGFVHTPDVMATILDFLGIRVPDGLYAKSLLPLMTGEEEGLHDRAVSGHHGLSWSIRDETWSLYLWLGPQAKYTWGLVEERPLMERARPELYRIDRGFVPPRPAGYDPERDMAERENLIDKEPEVAAALELELRRFMDRLKWQG